MGPPRPILAWLFSPQCLLPVPFPGMSTVHGGMLLVSIPSLVRLTGGTPRVWGAAPGCGEVPVPGKWEPQAVARLSIRAQLI